MIRSIKFLVLITVGLLISVRVQAASPLLDLQEISNADLQEALDKLVVANPRWRRLSDKNKLGVCLVDLQSKQAKFAAVNGGHMMYAASLPKIAILLAAYVGFEEGSLPENEANKKDLARMIRVSSNAAATRMIDRIGFEKIQAVLQDPQFRFYDKDNGGGLWVGKRYAATGKRIGDPLKNISHAANAEQVCRFFYLLAQGELINAERSEQMLNDLGKPKLHHKFVSQTDKRAPKARVYRKSGSWRRWHADAILVRGEHWRNYVLVALVEHPDGENVLRNLLPAVEGLIKPK